MASIGYIMNLATGDGLMFAIVPSSITENYAAIYNKESHIAAAYQRTSFSNTENTTLSFQLLFDRKVFARQAKNAKKYNEAKLLRYMKSSKAFLQSLTFPRKHQGSMLTASPPRCLIVWPEVLSMKVVVESVSFEHRSFDSYGRCVEYVANMELSENRFFPIYSDAIREIGSIRGGRTSNSFVFDD